MALTEFPGFRLLKENPVITELFLYIQIKLTASLPGIRDCFAGNRIMIFEEFILLPV